MGFIHTVLRQEVSDCINNSSFFEKFLWKHGNSVAVGTKFSPVPTVLLGYPPPIQETASELWCLSGGLQGRYRNCSVHKCHTGNTAQNSSDNLSS